MSTRESGIPLLTEIIEDSDMEFIGPPAPDTLGADHAHDAPAALNAPGALETPAAPLPPLQGNAPEPAYPLPLKPAAPAAAETPPPFARAPLPAMPAQAEPAQPALPPAPQPPIPPAPQTAALSEEDWMRMERRIRERILGQLLARTDAMLEERIRSGISNMLQDAVDDLAAALRHNLHKTLDDVVSRAVAQEISRLQSLKK